MSENKLEIFTNPEFGKVRVLEKDNEPWFVGKEIALILGYSDLTHCIINHIDEDDRINSKTQGINDPEFGQRGAWLINESGLYSLIIGSKLPNAKKFKRWVTSEVLPSIRKTGSYSTQQTTSIVTITPDIATKLLENNQNNRPINLTRVKALAQDMLIGKWEVNGETIKIYEDGTLADGQHRLSACVMSGVPFQTYIVRNLHKEVLPTIDCGEKRSIVHGLKMKGIDIDSKLIPTFNLLFNKGSKLTSPQTEFLFNKYFTECQLVTKLLPRGQQDFRSKSTFRAFSLYLLVFKDYAEDKLREFVNGMAEKPTCITNFEQTCYYYRRWYERNIFGKRAIGSGSFNRGNLRIREFDGLLQCLESFENNRLVKQFRYTGRGTCELEQCSKIIKHQFECLEQQTRGLLGEG